MRIGINTRFLLPTKMEGFGWYTFEVVKRLVENHPEHEFVFFFDRSYDPKFVFASNVKPVVLFPPARHPFLFIWWFEWSIQRALKREQIDVFFSPDGYLSLGSNIPQVGVIHDLNFEHHPEDIPRTPRWYLRKYFPKFAKKASHILTVSEYSKKDICSTYAIPEDKISVAWNGASTLFKPLGLAEIEETRSKYSKGKAYFVFVGALHPRKNVGRLVEAFAQFYTQNKSIELVIVGENLWSNTSLQLPSISEEVKKAIHFTGHVPLHELTRIMGAAHALVYVPYFEGFGIPLVEAMRCGVPILSGNLTCLPEVAGDAAIYCDPFDVKEIAKGMKRLSTDETLCTQLKKNGLERSELFIWDKTAAKVWDVLSSFEVKK